RLRLSGDRTCKRSVRFLITIELLIGERQIVVRDRKVWIERDGMLERLDRARHHVHAAQQGADVGVGFSPVRIDRQTLLVADECVLAEAESLEREGEI